MYVIFRLVVFVFKVLNVLDVILQKVGIKLLRVTKERVLKGKRVPFKLHSIWLIIKVCFQTFIVPESIVHPEWWLCTAQRPVRVNQLQPKIFLATPYPHQNYDTYTQQWFFSHNFHCFSLRFTNFYRPYFEGCRKVMFLHWTGQGRGTSPSPPRTGYTAGGMPLAVIKFVESNSTGKSRWNSLIRYI